MLPFFLEMLMLLKLLRESLGRVIVLIDWLTRPKPMQRTASEQDKVNAKAERLKLYQLYACPFCIKTRRAIRRLNLPVETRNVNQGSPYRQELEQGGGQIQVPCLRIESEGTVNWMYESSDIIAYLEQEFAIQPSLAEITRQHQN
jgi:glutaredoxin